MRSSVSAGGRPEPRRLSSSPPPCLARAPDVAGGREAPSSAPTWSVRREAAVELPPRIRYHASDENMSPVPSASAAAEAAVCLLDTGHLCPEDGRADRVLTAASISGSAPADTTTARWPDNPPGRPGPASAGRTCSRWSPAARFQAAGRVPRAGWPGGQHLAGTRAPAAGAPAFVAVEIGRASAAPEPGAGARSSPKRCCTPGSAPRRGTTMLIGSVTDQDLRLLGQRAPGSADRPCPGSRVHCSSPDR